jgi:hypothetical protein
VAAGEQIQQGGIGGLDVALAQLRLDHQRQGVVAAFTLAQLGPQRPHLLEHVVPAREALEQLAALGAHRELRLLAAGGERRILHQLLLGRSRGPEVERFLARAQAALRGLLALGRGVAQGDVDDDDLRVGRVLVLALEVLGLHEEDGACLLVEAAPGRLLGAFGVARRLDLLDGQAQLGVLGVGVVRIVRGEARVGPLGSLPQDLRARARGQLVEQGRSALAVGARAAHVDVVLVALLVGDAAVHPGLVDGLVGHGGGERVAQLLVGGGDPLPGRPDEVGEAGRCRGSAGDHALEGADALLVALLQEEGVGHLAQHVHVGHGARAAPAAGDDGPQPAVGLVLQGREARLPGALRGVLVDAHRRVVVAQPLLQVAVVEQRLEASVGPRRRGDALEHLRQHVHALAQEVARADAAGVQAGLGEVLVAVRDDRERACVEVLLVDAGLEPVEGLGEELDALLVVGGVLGTLGQGLAEHVLGEDGQQLAVVVLDVLLEASLRGLEGLDLGRAAGIEGQGAVVLAHRPVVVGQLAQLTLDGAQRVEVRHGGVDGGTGGAGDLAGRGLACGQALGLVEQLAAPQHDLQPHLAAEQPRFLGLVVVGVLLGEVVDLVGCRVEELEHVGEGHLGADAGREGLLVAQGRQTVASQILLRLPGLRALEHRHVDLAGQGEEAVLRQLLAELEVVRTRLEARSQAAQQGQREHGGQAAGQQAAGQQTCQEARERSGRVTGGHHGLGSREWRGRGRRREVGRGRRRLLACERGGPLQVAPLEAPRCAGAALGGAHSTDGLPRSQCMGAIGVGAGGEVSVGQGRPVLRRRQGARRLRAGGRLPRGVLPRDRLSGDLRLSGGQHCVHRLR